MSKINWFYEIGQEIKDDKRDLVIIDREIRPTERKDERKKTGFSKINLKYYKLKCNKCGYDEWWIEENNLKNGYGCPCCANKIAVLGYNTIWDTDRWMCDLGVSIEDAKKYTHGSGQKIWVTCPDCGEQRNVQIRRIHNDKSIGCSCGDGTSYPEKVMFSLLKQLNINFKTQLNKKDFDWCDKYKYDFYLEDYNIIIEVHGKQHYEESSGIFKRLNEQQKIDKTKKYIALNNGIDNYIIIDCRKSDLEFIKNNILNSELNNLFDLFNIDWNKCEEYALSNIIKGVCDYWHLHNDINNEGLSTIDLAKQFNTTYKTIGDYLKKGTKLGWCNYNPKLSIKKPVCIYKYNILLGVFESTNELERVSENLFNIRLSHSKISEVCNGNRKTHQGFTFKFATKEEYEEAVKNNTINKRIDNIELEQVS